MKRAARRLCAGALATLLLHGAARALPDFASVRAAHRPSDVELLDRHGAPLQSVRIDTRVRRLPWVALADLSPALREAIVASEDRRFWEHGGVDWRALAASAWVNAWNARTRGASTLTMQLAGLLDADLARPADGRTVPQKLRQIALARELEARWSKAQILEAYLNRVPLRGDSVGVPAAAQVMFGKHPSGLDRLEAALLAVLVRAPNAGEAAVARRACELLQQQHLTCQGVATLTAQALARRPGASGGAAWAPHFARWWLQRPARDMPAAPRLRTTLDAGLQRLALSALRQQLSELRGREVEDGAVVVLDNRSGEVLAWVGSTGGGSAAPDVDAVLARRQPGSTLKPFVYAAAFERGLLTPHSLLPDVPMQLAAGNDTYQPRNFDRQFRGWVSAREALAGSLNVPAVRVGAMLGADELFDTLQRAGLRPRESAGFHGHALALGSAEVTLLDLVNAYRMLANGGVWSEVGNEVANKVGSEVGNEVGNEVANKVGNEVANKVGSEIGSRAAGSARGSRRVFSGATAQAVNAILSDPAARAATFGFDSPLVTRHAAAVKTGTSKDMRDNWCVGSTAAYTVGVWIGNASGAPMHGVSGVVGAAPVWRRLVEALPATPTLQASAGGALAGGATAGSAVAGARRAGTDAFSITPVQPGGVLALDPDRPLAEQRLHLRGPAGRWLMDGRAIGRGTDAWWTLAPGRHVVEVRDAGGETLDRVEFEVRPGAPAAAVRPPRG